MGKGADINAGLWKHREEMQLTDTLLYLFLRRLWEVMGFGVEVFWRLRNHPHEYDFVEAGVFMSTIYSVVDLCVKGLTKGDKKTNLSVNTKGVISITLEKSLGIIFFRGKELLRMIQENPKDEKSLKRELEAETVRNVLSFFHYFSSSFFLPLLCCCFVCVWVTARCLMGTCIHRSRIISICFCPEFSGGRTFPGIVV